MSKYIIIIIIIIIIINARVLQTDKVISPNIKKNTNLGTGDFMDILVAYIYIYKPFSYIGFE
jgi:amino acid permease